MGITSEVDKDREVAVALPRMLGDTDVGLILDFAGRLPDGANILEVGPWLGGLTRDLARFGAVTVVDRFIWSEGNDVALPGLASPGDSFRPLFEENIETAGVSVQIVETDLINFEWHGGVIDLAVIDAPRTPDQLHNCLSTISGALQPNAVILVKHGLNRSDIGMGVYLDALMGLGVLEMVATEQPDWCNIAVLRPGPAIAKFPKESDALDLVRTAPLPRGISDPWYGRLLSVARLGYLAQLQDWTHVWRRLADLPPSGDNLTLWDGLEANFHVPDESTDPNWAVFAEMFWVQNDNSLAASPPVSIGTGLPPRLRAYWSNNREHAWRADLFDPALLASTIADHEIELVTPDAHGLLGADVVQVGGMAMTGGLPALLAGARTYTLVSTDGPATIPEGFDRFPHFSVAHSQSDIAASLTAASAILLVRAPDEGSEIAQFLAARTRDHTHKPLVIDLRV